MDSGDIGSDLPPVSTTAIINEENIKRLPAPLIELLITNLSMSVNFYPIVAEQNIGEKIC
jgi:hypothetical protein